MDNKELQNTNNLTDEQLFIACVRRSAFFKEAMLRAFKHGLEYEHLETDGDMDYSKTKEKNCPFAEWFAWHYA